MRRTLLSILLVFCFLSLHAQTVNLSKMQLQQRNEYLLTLAKEVTRNFGPDYYREYKDPEISEEKVFEGKWDKSPEVQRCVGRKYYTVTFRYDRTKERLNWHYASQVDIWADDGEPQGVLFGSGIGVHFFERPYRQWVRDGIKENDKIPYKNRPLLKPQESGK